MHMREDPHLCTDHRSEISESTAKQLQCSHAIRERGNGRELSQ
jgi:hypothetical protein